MAVYSARIGEIIIGDSSDELEALALGSCVAVVIYDDVIKVGAMAHVLLPEQLNTDMATILGKYANTAIPETIRMVLNKGASRERLKAKIAGGARMFELTGTTPLTLDVGARNVQKIKELLKAEHIPIISEDIGDRYGRTVKFNLNTFILQIKLGLKKIVRQI
jgi:chemotaxis protein CheD